MRSASNLDDLLKLTDFPDWKLWKCRLKLQQPKSRAETVSSPASVGSHRSTRYAAESYSLEILKGWRRRSAGLLWTFAPTDASFSSCSAIDEEWQRTQCTPRETCVDVAKELGTEPATFFKPPCVSLHRWVQH